MQKFILSGLQCERKSHLECHYKVDWSINPHMVTGSTQINLAIEQHARLRSALEETGSSVIEVPFVCGAYDSVFVKDNAFLFQTKHTSYALTCQLKANVRHSEQPRRIQHLNISDSKFYA